jgi:hypothetical protein
MIEGPRRRGTERCFLRVFLRGEGGARAEIDVSFCFDGRTRVFIWSFTIYRCSACVTEYTYLSSLFLFLFPWKDMGPHSWVTGKDLFTRPHSSITMLSGTTAFSRLKREWSCESSIY